MAVVMMMVEIRCYTASAFFLKNINMESQIWCKLKYWHLVSGVFFLKNINMESQIWCKVKYWHLGSGATRRLLCSRKCGLSQCQGRSGLLFASLLHTQVDVLYVCVRSLHIQQGCTYLAHIALHTQRGVLYV